VTLGVWTYVWPQGDVVHVFGDVEYVRHLTGEIRDAEPCRYLPVAAFNDFEDFRAWCRNERPR
jgi:hypothetical protein